MARWNGNVLMHNWYGSKDESRIGEFLPNEPKSFGPLYRDLYNKGRLNGRRYVFIADTIDDMFVRYYYSKPTADEVLASFLNWQNQW